MMDYSVVYIAYQPHIATNGRIASAYSVHSCEPVHPHSLTSLEPPSVCNLFLGVSFKEAKTGRVAPQVLRKYEF